MFFVFCFLGMALILSLKIVFLKLPSRVVNIYLVLFANDNYNNIKITPIYIAVLLAMCLRFEA